MPKPKTVFIMPGIDTAAPLRTESSSGFSAEPKTFPVAFSRTASAPSTSPQSSAVMSPASIVSAHSVVAMTKPGGTLRPRRAICFGRFREAGGWGGWVGGGLEKRESNGGERES